MMRQKKARDQARLVTEQVHRRKTTACHPQLSPDVPEWFQRLNGPHSKRKYKVYRRENNKGEQEEAELATAPQPTRPELAGGVFQFENFLEHGAFAETDEFKTHAVPQPPSVTPLSSSYFFAFANSFCKEVRATDVISPPPPPPPLLVTAAASGQSERDPKCTSGIATAVAKWLDSIKQVEELEEQVKESVRDEVASEEEADISLFTREYSYHTLVNNEAAGAYEGEAADVEYYQEFGTADDGAFALCGEQSFYEDSAIQTDAAAGNLEIGSKQIAVQVKTQGNKVIEYEGVYELANGSTSISVNVKKQHVLQMLLKEAEEMKEEGNRNEEIQEEASAEHVTVARNVGEDIFELKGHYVRMGLCNLKEC